MPVGFSLDATFGALYLAVPIGGYLLGIFTVQAWTYFHHFPRDPLGIKLLVATVVLLEVIHQVFVTLGLYHYLITGFGDFSTLLVAHWILLSEVSITGLVALLCQSFLLWRIYVLSNRRLWIVAPLMMLALASFIIAVAWNARTMQLRYFTAVPKVRSLSISLTATTAFTDVCITIALVTLLLRVRTGITKSDSIIARVITFVISSGLATSICAVASMSAFIISDTKLIFALFFLLLSRLYAMSLLATLNARRKYRGSAHASRSMTASHFDLTFSSCYQMNIEDHAINLPDMGKSLQTTSPRDIGMPQPMRGSKNTGKFDSKPVNATPVQSGYI